MISKVLEIIIEIKNKLSERGVVVSYKQSIGETCLERWVRQLNEPLYTEMFQYIQTSQKDNLVLVRYGRYSSVFSSESEVDYGTFWDMYDNFYRECRSIVIDVKNEEVVLFPFNKFFNIGENEETSIENVLKRIEKASIFQRSDKLDGSMQCARYYRGNIVMSGSQAIDPENSWRLKDGLRMLTESENHVKMLKTFSDWTFIFEYISLADSHVVNYTKEQEGIYLIGIRNSVTGEQFTYSSVMAMKEMYDIKATELVNKTLEEIISELDDKQSNEAEGFVLYIDGFMVKIKYNQYQQFHRILSSISSIQLIINNIADNTFDDLISKVPDAYKWRVQKVANIVFDYIKSVDSIVKNYCSQIKNMEFKDAMIWIQNNVDKQYRGYVIEMFKGKEVNYIKSRNGHVKKLNEMGISNEDYYKIFQKDEEIY